MGIRNFYLNNDVPSPEYMRLSISVIPEEIVQQYNLLSLAHNGFVNILINKGMYGLPQAGKIAHNELASPPLHRLDIVPPIPLVSGYTTRDHSLLYSL